MKPPESSSSSAGEPGRPVVLEYARPEKSRSGRLIAAGLASLLVQLASMVALFASGEAAMVLVAVAVVTAVVALGLGIVAFWNAPARSPHRRAAGALVAFSMIVLGLLGLAISPPRPPGQSFASWSNMVCSSRLSQIARGIMLYVIENRGKFPADLGSLLVAEDLSPEVFVCPASSDMSASGATTQQVVDDFTSQPGRCSYIYLGAGQTAVSCPKGFVIAYEPLKHHKTGIHMLVGGPFPGSGCFDFICEEKWLPASEAQYLISELAAGHNPPRERIPAQTQPATRP